MVCRVWVHERVPLNSHWLVLTNGGAPISTIVGLLILYSKNVLGLYYGSLARALAIFFAVFLVNKSLSGHIIFVSRIIAASSWPRDSLS